jgi:hypothetical protein
MVTQSTIWSNPASIAAQIVADSIKKFETHEVAKRRAAEKQAEQRQNEKKS